jgi:uncharacterized protein
VPALSVVDLLVLAVAASLVGLSKTALPGAGTLSVAAFAAVLPAKQSTGALLVLLILGDLFAVWTYHAHADWRTLRRMVPAVLAGIGVGTLFLAVADDVTVRRVIGVILLALVVVTLWRRRVEVRASVAAARGGVTVAAGEDDPSPRRRRVEAGVYGVLAGFTTMVANAGGPVMSMYLLAARFPVQRFLGTAAWFFLVVNVTKVPFSVSLGLISPGSLTLDLLLAPAVVVGALLGRRLARRIDQRLFDRLVLVLTVVSATYLVLQQ